MRRDANGAKGWRQGRDLQYYDWPPQGQHNQITFTVLLSLLPPRRFTTSKQKGLSRGRQAPAQEPQQGVLLTLVMD